METLKIGQAAPAFSLEDDQGNRRSLSDFLGKWVVLYFYPKDNTSGCTLEANDFTSEIAWFHAQGAEVVGVSPDSVKSHCNFRDKHGLKVVLLSDPDKQALEAYGVWVKKSMYGREYMGVRRATALIDPQGVLVHAWPEVKVKGHVAEVKAKLSALKNG